MRQRGFTLIEVLVALGIVAIALVAGLQATTALTNNALRQSDILLAAYQHRLAHPCFIVSACDQTIDQPPAHSQVGDGGA